MNVHAIESWLSTTALAQLKMVFVASSLLCVASWLLCGLLRRHSAAVRFGVWQLALCGIVLSTLLIVTVDGIPLGLVPVADQAGTPAVDAGTMSGHIALGQQAEASTPSFAQLGGHESPLAASTASTSNRTRTSIGAIVAALWLAFAAAMLARFVPVYARHAQGIVRRARRVASPQMINVLDIARARIGLNATREVQLRQTDELTVPFTIGILRSTVVIPEAAREWSSTKLEMVLAHELAHVLRRDVPAHWLSRLSCCAAGFNPLTWLAQRHCVFERERACDDRVLRAGYSAADYGQSLLEVAAAMGGRTRVPTLGVSMAYPHFRRRLETLLATGVDRRPLSKNWIWPLLALFVTLTTAVGALRPFNARLAASEPPPPAVVEPTKSTPVPQAGRKEALGRGTLTDSDGQPISGASVDIQLEELESEGSASGKMIRSWQATTDERGAYQFDAGPVDALPRNSQIRIQVSVVGFVESDARWLLTGPEVATGDWLIATKLWKAKKISGRIVDSHDSPVAGIVYAAGSNGDPNQTWWLNGVEVATDGGFEIAVPLKMDTELLVFVDSHAPTRVAVNRDAIDLGDIRAAHGTRIVGRLLNRDDQPLEGVVIAMSSHDDSQLRDVSFSAQSATITNAEGRFTLPASSGKCQIWAAASAYSMETGGKMITGVAPPPVIPIEVDLSNNPAVTEVTVSLKEAETVTISGTARWENGDPAANLEVKAGEIGANLASVKTGADGKYQIKLPRPLSAPHLMAIGLRNSAGVWLMAHGQCAGIPSPHPQIIEFKDLSADKSNVDWILKPRQKQP